MSVTRTNRWAFIVALGSAATWPVVARAWNQCRGDCFPLRFAAHWLHGRWIRYGCDSHFNQLSPQPLAAVAVFDAKASNKIVTGKMTSDRSRSPFSFLSPHIGTQVFVSVNARPAEHIEGFAPVVIRFVSL